jgi:hypothetical protein
MEKHINLLGILWIAYGALNLLIALLFFSLFFGISFIPDIEVKASIILRVIATSIFFILFLFSVPDIIGGIWLMKKQEWARILILIFAFLNIIAFPIGTALSIYTFVILFNNEAIQLFKK